MSTNESSGLAAEMELRAHFDKKRDFDRCWIGIPVELEGRAGSIKVRLIDVSRSGVLLAMTDPAFRYANDLLECYQRVQERLGTGAIVRFAGRAFSLRGDVARVTECPFEGRTLLAVQFVDSLTPDQCASLGIPAE